MSEKCTRVGHLKELTHGHHTPYSEITESSRDCVLLHVSGTI